MSERPAGAGRPVAEDERRRRARRAALWWGLVALVLYVGYMAYLVLRRR